MKKAILVASGKGGTGKSMFSVNLGAILAMQGLRTVIVDMDLGLRNIDLYLGLENNVVYDAFDVMTGVCSISQALIRDERFPHLYFIGASPVREEGTITPLHAQVLMEKLAERFDYIIIDAPAGIDDGLVVASAGADLAILVSTPEYASLRNVGTLDRVLLKLGLTRRFLILNRIVPQLMQKGYVPSLEEIDAHDPAAHGSDPGGQEHQHLHEPGRAHRGEGRHLHPQEL